MNESQPDCASTGVPLQNSAESFQMAYSKATEIGCAHNTCGDKLQVFCLYNRM